MASILTIPMFTGLSRPASGSQHRTKALLEQLKRLGHDNIVLESTTVYSETDTQVARVYCYNELKVLGFSLWLLRDFNPAFVIAVFRILKLVRIDFVQVSHPSGVLAVRIAQKLLRKDAPIVYDAHNIDYELMHETMLGNSHYPWLVRVVSVVYNRILEGILVRFLARAVLVVSGRDASKFVEIYRVRASRIHEVPSGCHVRTRPTAETKKKAREELAIAPSKTVIIFHGLYSYPPNREAFDLIETEIAPRIGRRFPDAIFILAGTHAPRMDKENVRSIGFVPDLDKFLACADVAIVPIIHGSGTRLKVLDYLSAGLPIVSTRKGAEGLDLENGTHILLVDNTAESLEKGLEALLTNKHSWNKLTRNAREVAEQKYDWDVIGRKLDELYAALGHA